MISELVRSQFATADETCEPICQKWEGSRFALNTICRKRFKDCVQRFYEGYFEDKSRIAANAFSILWANLFPGNN